MDAMAFGMGCCSLQCTFSTKNLDHARYVYDQLNVLSPIFLALTAGSPFFKGKVSDWDVRWNVICDSNIILRLLLYLQTAMTAPGNVIMEASKAIKSILLSKICEKHQ